MATLKQLIDVIRDTATVDFAEEIQATYYEKFSFTQDEDAYPRLSFFVADNGITLNENVNVAIFRFQLLDQLSGRVNEDVIREDLPSDLIDLASRFTSKLYYDKNVLINYPINITHVDKTGKDGVTAIRFDLSINLARPCLET